MSREVLDEAASRARPVSLAGQHVVPVLAPLAPLFPEGGLRRGSTLVVRGGVGATSLALSVAAAASQAESWCAALGWPALGMVAAAGLGIALERFALVPHPGEQWPAVAAALIDAVDLVLLRLPRGVRLPDARRLMARARERGVILVVCGAGAGAGVAGAAGAAGASGLRAWPGVDLALSVVEVGEWCGLGHGYGYLHARSVEVTSIGRGAASREQRVRLWLPGSGGTVEGRERRLDNGQGSATASAAGY